MCVVHASCHKREMKIQRKETIFTKSLFFLFFSREIYDGNNFFYEEEIYYWPDKL